MRKALITVTLVTFALTGATACATKKFVTEQVGGVNSKVDTLAKGMEENQQRTRQNEDKIAGVDQKAGAAQGAAGQAQQTATSATSKADAATAAAAAAAAKAAEVDKYARRLMYTVVLDSSQSEFKSGDSKLPDAAKAKIDELMAKVKADGTSVYVEVEGYTDSTGTPELNKKLGLSRAESVRDYLYKQHQVPLFRINVISFGDENPVGDNKTKEGRAKNRRIVIKILG